MKTNQSKFRFILAIAFSFFFLQLTDFIFYYSHKLSLNSSYFLGKIELNSWVSTFLPIVVLVLLFFFIKDKTEYRLFAFISAAALSNLLDRLIYGGVVDYIRIGSWPTFNLADCFIVICLIGLGIKKIWKVV